MTVWTFYLFALHTVSYLVTNQSGRYFHTVRAGQTSLVKFNFQSSESNRKDRMSFLPPKLGAVWKFWPSGAIQSFRSEFPYCSQLRREEWHSIFSIAFWSLKVRFGKTGLTSSDSMEIPSRLVSYQVWHSIRCEKIECLHCAIPMTLCITGSFKSSFILV